MGQPANPGSPGKMAVKTECVCVCVLFHCFMMCSCCRAALRDIFHTPTAKHSLFVLKAPLNTDQMTKESSRSSELTNLLTLSVLAK